MRAALDKPFTGDFEEMVKRRMIRVGVTFNRTHLRDECLNAHIFASTIEAQRVLDAWREDYNHVRPHSALQDRTPVDMGALWVDSREPRESTALRKN